MVPDRPVIGEKRVTRLPADMRARTKGTHAEAINVETFQRFIAGRVSFSLGLITPPVTPPPSVPEREVSAEQLKLGKLPGGIAKNSAPRFDWFMNMRWRHAI